jgi:hypothetical protein
MNEALAFPMTAKACLTWHPAPVGLATLRTQGRMKSSICA